jgi:hypothetical protein
MYYNNNLPDNIFAIGHRNLTLGTVLLGGLLFLLAIMIFTYPALIAYFIAAMILSQVCPFLLSVGNFGDLEMRLQNWIKTVLFTKNHPKPAKPILPISGDKE